MNTLTLDDLHELVPAAFAEEPALDRVSGRYSFIPTTNLIERLRQTGWFPVSARQSHRAADVRHTTHMITFRQPNPEITIGGAAAQVILTNNHMGLRRATLLAGFIKWACSNGLMVSAGVAETKANKIHIDNANLDFEQAFETAMYQLDTAVAQIAAWQKTELNFVQELDFASKAVLMKNNNDPVWSKHFDAREFLTRRRPEDRGHDLWSVFNVVQENMLQGGVMGVSRITRPITQVAETMRINQGLWNLTNAYHGELHGNN